MPSHLLLQVLAQRLNLLQLLTDLLLNLLLNPTLPLSQHQAPVQKLNTILLLLLKPKVLRPLLRLSLLAQAKPLMRLLKTIQILLLLQARKNLAPKRTKRARITPVSLPKSRKTLRNQTRKLRKLPKKLINQSETMICEKLECKTPNSEFCNIFNAQNLDKTI